MEIENIKNNEILKDLTDDQARAVSELVANHENTVIAEKTREIWDSVDADILSVTGQSKPHNVKSYSFLKSVLTDTKTAAETAAAQYNESQSVITKLEESLKNNTGDESLKSKIGDYENVISKLRQDIEQKEIEKNEAIKLAQSENVGLRFDNVFNESLRGLNFKPGIPEVSINATLDAAKNSVLGLGAPVFENNTITFKDDKGITITDPNNLQNPITAKDKFIEIIKPILDTGKTQVGTGSKGTTQENDLIDMSGVPNKIEADRVISKHIASKGVAKGTKAYQIIKDELWQKHKVADLPLR